MKKIILCCDGTWNTADQEHDGVPCPTNVVKIAYRIAKRDNGTPQIIYYDQGVGTGNVLDHFTGGALGEGLEDNIHDAYRFLIGNYEPGDEIYLFGFSRGAFTARSIAGMIRKCGILKREFIQHYHAANDLYHTADVHPDDAGPVKFRTDYSVSANNAIPIKFIGVWDTVGALGIPLRGLRSFTRGKNQFHDTELSGTVQYAYHALAIDEHRAPFKPTLWAYKPKPGQTVEQTWFCGAHSDVGGGYSAHGLSDISLDWMMGKARGAGLAFDDAAIKGHPLESNPQGQLHNSKTGLYLVTSGIDRVLCMNAADPTKPDDSALIDDPNQSVHDSVKTRWDKDSSYRPAALREYFKKTGDKRGAAN